MLEYHLGDEQAASEWANKFLASSADVPVHNALALGVLAMGQVRSGGRDAASESVNQLSAILQEGSPIRTGGRLSEDWHDWLVCEIFLRELHRAQADAEQ